MPPKNSKRIPAVALVELEPIPRPGDGDFEKWCRQRGYIPLNSNGRRRAYAHELTITHNDDYLLYRAGALVDTASVDENGIARIPPEPALQAAQAARDAPIKAHAAIEAYLKEAWQLTNEHPDSRIRDILIKAMPSADAARQTWQATETALEQAKINAGHTVLAKDATK